MVGGKFQGSNESPWSGYETLHEVTAAPDAAGESVTLSGDTAYRYYRYLAPTGSYGNIAEFSVDLEAPASGPSDGDDSADSGDTSDTGDASDPDDTTDSGDTADSGDTSDPDDTTDSGDTDDSDDTADSGDETTPEVAYPDGYRETEVSGVTVFGLDPAWKAGREFEKVYDGSASTYYDYAHGDSESFTGLDVGASREIEAIHFRARDGFESRMIGGRFEGSNESSVTGYEVLHTVESAPDSGEERIVSLPDGAAYRYVRYVAPAGSYGNIAEMAVSVGSVSDGGGDGESSPDDTDTGSGDTADGTDGGSDETNEETDETDGGSDESNDETNDETDGGSGDTADGSGDTSAPGSVAAGENGSGAQVTFELAEAGQVSVGIYDQDNRLVRTLMRGAELEAGTHEAVWDGLDRNGVPQGPGTYTAKVLRSDGLKSEYITNLGLNPGTTSYDTWVGNHDGAASVAVDATGMYVAAQVTETAPVLIKQSFDGATRHWEVERGDVTEGRFQGGSALAADQNGRVYMLQQNGRLQVIDADNGRLLDSWDVLPAGVARERFLYQHTLGNIAGADVAAHGGTLVLSFRDQNVVQWLDTGSGAVVREVAVDSPRGVAVNAAGDVFVIRGADNSVLRVNGAGDVAEWIGGGPWDPQRLSVDPDDGSLLVSHGRRGARIYRFHPDGSYARVYGREGGRRMGDYEPTDFYGVTDVAADRDGGFRVAEPERPPRRLAHMDGSGELVREWYGGQSYYAWAEPDPKDPGLVWFFTGDGLVLARIDLATGDWTVKETWVAEELADGLIRQVYGHVGGWRVLYNDGVRYLVSEATPQVLRHDADGLRPVSVSSNHGPQIERALEISGWSGSAHSFRWLDGNGDGEPQPSEFTFSGHRQVASASSVADDFSLISYRRPGDAFEVRRTEAKWSVHGPYYPIGDESGVEVAAASKPTVERTGVRGSGVHMGADGSFYGHYHLERERHGFSWPTFWASVTRFVKWDASGTELWSVGRHAYDLGLPSSFNTIYKPADPGELHIPVGVIGEVGDTVVLADRVETLGMAWSHDGLYVGSMFDRRADDGLPEGVYAWFATPDGADAITTSDNASGGRVIEYPDGTVLWFTQGRNSVPVYEVTGWDAVDRMETAFELTADPASAEANGGGLRAAYFDGRFSDGADSERVEPQIWHGVPKGVDGHDEIIDGPEAPAVDWTGGFGADGDFRARWTGEIEAPLSESYTFSVYARGGVRLWIDGEQVIHSWNSVTDRVRSEPVELEAGKRYAIQLDYRSKVSAAQPAVSLNWESLSIDRERVPGDFLYPVSGIPVQTVYRDAAEHIDAPEFDLQSGAVDAKTMDDFAVTGLRQWGFSKSGAWLGYRSVDFGDGVSRIRVQAGADPAGDSVERPMTLAFRIGSPDGPLIAEVDLPREVGTVEFPAEGVTGEHDVYVINTSGEVWHFMDFRWFRFE